MYLIYSVLSLICNGQEAREDDLVKTAKKYIDELFSCEDCSDSVIIGSKKIFEDKLCTITSQYIDDGLPKRVAEEKAKNDLHTIQRCQFG